MSPTSNSWADPLRGAAALFGHAAGVIAMSGGLMAVAVGGSPAVVLRSWASNGEIIGNQVPHIAAHLVLGAVFWATLFSLGRKLWGTKRRSHEPKRVIKLARGNVMTETLIVLPVALLLYIGLVQLSINNIAATLANVAAFQAGRSVWVWMPEAKGGRSSVSSAVAADKARIQAAMAVTPVVAGDYFMDFRNLSPAAKQARAGLVAAQLPILATDQGAYVNDAVLLGLSMEDPGGLIRLAVQGNQAMDLGLDKSSFRLRSARKFTFAYLATRVNPVSRNGRVGAQINYMHFNSMPIVGRAFGTMSTVGGRTGIYSSYMREFTLPEQYDANPELP